jgi:hypothetical protein
MHHALNKDAPFYRPIERLGAIISCSVLGGFTTDIAESSFRRAQPETFEL